MEQIVSIFMNKNIQMQLSFQPFTLQFKYPFKIAHGVRTSTPVVIVKIKFEQFIGYGEASMPPYLGESHESVMQFLEKAKPIIENLKFPFNMDEVLNEIDAIEQNNTAAKASIDIALHDLLGKITNQPIWNYFKADKLNAPNTTFTIGIDDPEVLKQKVKEASDYKMFKVKLNGEDDQLIINTIRSVTNKPIAVDVNQGWKNKEEAIKKIEWLTTQNVVLVEQPLLKTNLEDAFWLYQRSPLPIYADETVQRLKDIDSVKDCFHGINIKLMKCTGLNEANKMIKNAINSNLKVLIGCMSETSCAISAAAQLSPFATYADLDGALLIKNNPFGGLNFVDGKISLSDLPGLGVFPIDSEVE
jgi:L-alanine-DL-glutamate epimerase-like enolase superfamily enzyme